MIEHPFDEKDMFIYVMLTFFFVNEFLEWRGENRRKFRLIVYRVQEEEVQER